MKKQRWLAMLVTVAMVCMMLSMTAFAESVNAGVSINGQSYDTLEAAITAAVDGDTIQLKDGTYNGNINIEKSVTIVGESKGGTVIVRTENTGNILHATKSIVLKNLTIDGEDTSGNHILGHGIYAEGGLVMNNVDVINVVCRAESPICGVQTGVAVYVNNPAGGTNAEDVLIQNVNIKNFQKGGIVCKSTGSVLIENVTIVGDGSNNKIAQNGIQINNTKDAVISNTSISEVAYEGDDSASGLILVNGAEVQVENVAFENVQSDFGFYDENETTKAVVYVKEGDTITKITEEYPEGEVIHKISKTEANAATCVEDGNIEYWYCEICDEYYSDAACTDVINEDDTVIPAKGHGETEIKNAKNATCTEEGYTGDKVCKDCGAVLEQGEAIAKLAHTYQDGKCTVCGAADPNYVPAESTPTPDPTDTPNPTPTPVPTDKQNMEVPKTGDNSNMMLWGMLLLVAGAGITGVVLYDRKRVTK